MKTVCSHCHQVLDHRQIEKNRLRESILDVLKAADGPLNMQEIADAIGNPRSHAQLGRILTYLGNEGLTRRHVSTIGNTYTYEGDIA